VVHVSFCRKRGRFNLFSPDPDSTFKALGSGPNLKLSVRNRTAERRTGPLFISINSVLRI
jgi:hypothetical protein